MSLLRKPWIWSFVAALAVFLITILATAGASTVGVAQAALTFAAISIIVGLGQMFVITLGPGNIDLAVPATMTLAATLALKFMDGTGALILPGLLIAILIGVAVGIVNYALIKLLRIPPIIATLAMSFVIQSAAIASNRGVRIKPPEALAAFTTERFLGVPNLAWVALLLSAGAWLLLNRAVYGRWISAIGQSIAAARMAGIPVDGVRLSTYILCAVLAALAGYLMGSFSGGAALDMGKEYLLMSIAVVVIGGSSVAGGDSNVPGIWGASLFLYLVVTMLNTYGLQSGVRQILTGIIIITVILVASGRTRTG